MTRRPALSQAALGELPADVASPADAPHGGGIVHLGVGAFHRAHQAAYLEDLRRLGATDASITAAGLRAQDRPVVEGLTAQDGLYTLTTRSPERTTTQVVGAIGRAVLAVDDPTPVVDLLAAPATTLITLTVTEGGYPVDDAGAFDPAAHARAAAAGPSAFTAIAAALARRRAEGTGPLAVLSCDNVLHNGAIARTAVLGAAEAVGGDTLAGWIADAVDFPSCVVDRITPATTDADRADVAARLGLADRVPVVAEPFRQWVVEDRFTRGRPPWELAGAELVTDVTPHERRKLQVLNAGHSLLGHLAVLLGIDRVEDAVSADLLGPLMRRFLHDEAVPAVEAATGLGAVAYAEDVVRRFTNPGIGDTTARLAGGGAAKLPRFLLPTLRANAAAGRPVGCATLVIAAWAHGLLATDPPAEDDLADLQDLARRAAAGDPAILLAEGPLADVDLRGDPRVVAAVTAAHRTIAGRGAAAAIRDVLAAGG